MHVTIIKKGYIFLKLDHLTERQNVRTENGSLYTGIQYTMFFTFVSV